MTQPTEVPEVELPTVDPDATYQVVGECAYATVPMLAGPGKTLLLKGALVPATAPELPHLLNVGLAAKVGGDERGGVNADGQPAAAVTAEAEIVGGAGDTPERKAARAKLAEDGSPPHPNAGDAVWIEYAVAKGYDYDAAKTAGKAELIKLLKPAT